MPSCFLLLVFFLAWLPPDQAGEAAPWKTVTPADKAFTIQFPGVPQEKVQKLKSGVDTLEVKNYLLKPEGSQPGFLLSHSEKVGSTADPLHPQAQLDQAQKAAMDSTRGQLVSAKKITLAKHPGTELVITTAQGLYFRTRIYVVHNRLYQVSVVGTQAQGTSPAAGKFLDSFQVKAD